MKPRIPITNRSFRYRPSYATDVRKTWAKATRATKQDKPQKVSPIRKVA